MSQPQQNNIIEEMLPLDEAYRGSFVLTQKLINHFLNHLPKIYNFFSDTFFDEEEALITELFQDITHFCRNLPKLTKK